MKNVFLLISLLVSCVHLTYSQSDEVLAKSYFLKAQQNYSEGNTATAMTNLDKTVEYLGSTNAKIESMYVKIYVASNNYIAAKNHLNTYFDKADESHSDYMEMLNIVADINNKAEAERKKKAEEERRKNEKEKEEKEFISSINFEKLDFKEGVAKIEFKSRDALVDKSGNLIVPFGKYFLINDFSEGLAAVVNKEGYGFINNTGKIVIPLQYDAAWNFSEGIAKVKINDKYGFIDKTGKEVTAFKYDRASSDFSDGLAKVKIGYKHGLIDRSGKEITPIKYDDMGSFIEGFAWVEIMYRYGFIDKTGKEITPIKYTSVKDFSEGLAAVCIPLNDHGTERGCGFIDTTGKTIVTLKYNNANSFSEGVARVKLNGREFNIDKFGKKVK